MHARKSKAPKNSRDLRLCLGKFATGVTVVTCRNGQGTPCGITANSFSSVSLEPPMILWNIANVSRSLQAYLTTDYFAINILTSAQKALSRHFARSDPGVFSGIEFRDSSRSVPLLIDTLAMIECRTYEVRECGDHHIIVGEIIDYRLSAGDPLLFYSGDYHSLDETGPHGGTGS